MSTQTLDSINTGNVVSAETLMECLRLVVADAEELLSTTSNQPGEASDVVRTRIQSRLTVIKARFFAAEAAVVEHTQQAAKVAGQYVHDNHWNWH